MPHQEKNTKGRSYNQLSILIPIAGTLFLKKPVSEGSPKENSIDFHLQMIKKIDRLLQEREPETPLEKSLSMGQRSAVPLPTSVESRAPLGRTPGHVEAEWELPIGPSLVKTRTIPEEFKTDLPLSMNPDFKFITSLDSAYDVLQIRPRTDERVEIIDISLLIGDQITSQKTSAPLFIKQPSKKNVSRSEQRQRKKTEVVDTKQLKQKTRDDAFITAMKQAETSEQKFKIYYLNSKTHKEKKLKKQEKEQSYIPVDFDERAEELKEQQEHEEQQKKEQEEKIHKQLEKEHEKLEKLETKKEKLEEKKQVKEQKEHKKEESPLRSEPEKTHMTEREQRRLERLEERKARLEEKKRKKEAKNALKEKKKQALLKQKGKEKKHKTTKEKHHKKVGFFKKEKHQASFELDNDIKKILSITDSLLGELPEDVIDRFTQSDDFELYERVLNKYKIK